MSISVLAILSHIPDPAGSAGEKRIHRFLSGLAGAVSLSCLAEEPPLSSRLLRAGLASKGVEVLGEAVPDEAAIHAKLRGAVRSRRFDAVLLVGPRVAERWARPLRLLIPGQAMLCYFPEAGALTRPAARFSAAVKMSTRVKWRGLLSLADGIWCSNPAEAESLRRSFTIEEGKIDVLPASLNGSAPRWFRGRLRRRSALRTSAPGRIDRVTVEPGKAAPAALNRAIGQGSGELVFVGLHAFAPSENLERTLAEGMRLLPYAGAAAPLDFSVLRPGLKGPLPMKEALFAAAWALKNKGGWHEVDALEHFCCLLLRRKAWEAAGRLDKRFFHAEFAWLDYFLRLQQAGFPVLLAQDALAFCAQDPKRGLFGREGGQEAEEDRDLLVDKWCKGSLKFMESLLTSLEPKGYRRDPKTLAANA